MLSRKMFDYMRQNSQRCIKNVTRIKITWHPMTLHPKLHKPLYMTSIQSIQYNISTISYQMSLTGTNGIICLSIAASDFKWVVLHSTWSLQPPRPSGVLHLSLQQSSNRYNIYLFFLTGKQNNHIQLRQYIMICWPDTNMNKTQKQFQFLAIGICSNKS